MANILIIDDAALIRKRMKNILLYDDHEVFELDTGKSIRNNSFSEEFSLDDIDVIFLDIYLKDENGFDILKYLSKNNPDIDVIIVSGENKISTVTKAVELGAKDFLAKPFDNQMILKKLEKILDKKAISKSKKSLVEDLNNELSSFNTDLNLELNRSLRSGLALSIIKVDFHNISQNDTFLKIKNDITTSIRDIDRVYFVDHKELCFLLPLTDKEGRKVFRKKLENTILEKDVLIQYITFPADIIGEESLELDFSQQNDYKKVILNKLEINFDDK